MAVLMVVVVSLVSRVGAADSQLIICLVRLIEDERIVSDVVLLLPHLLSIFNQGMGRFIPKSMLTFLLT